MEKVTAGKIGLAWDPVLRLAELTFEPGGHVTGDDARALVEALGQRVGNDERPFGVLGDGGGVSGVDVAYRFICAKFFRRHRRSCVLAFYNMSPLLRVAGEMFRIGTGVRMKDFPDEASARSWLCEMGITGDANPDLR